MHTGVVFYKLSKIVYSASSAAAENENESDDYYPKAVIIKEIAQAVIHSRVLPSKLKGLLPFDIIL